MPPDEEHELGVEVVAGDAVAQNFSAPSIRNLAPPPGSFCGKDVLVTATVTDPDGVAWVKIDGKKVTVAADGSVQAKVHIPPSRTEVSIEAADTLGNRICQTRRYCSAAR